MFLIFNPAGQICTYVQEFCWILEEGRSNLSVDNFHKSTCNIIWSFPDFLFGICRSEKCTRYKPQRRKIFLDLQHVQCLRHIISVRRCPSLLFLVSKLAFHLASSSLITPAGKGILC